MKTILLPTDFSSNSINAINYAINMFGEKNKYILLNAYRISPVSIEEYVSEIPDFAKESEKGLKKVLNKVKKEFSHKKLNIEIISRLGYPVEVLNKIVKRKKVDLTVMGTKGASGLKEILLGSITADAIKNLSCPILAVPEKAKYEPLKNIALAADLRNVRGEKLFIPLLSIVKNYAAEVVILHVQRNIARVTKNEKLEKIKLENLFRKIPHSFNLIEESNAARGIENFIRSRNIDLLAMVSRKHNLVERLFSKSATKKLAMHTKIPLLALQN